jgi:hypothetical protein
MPNVTVLGASGSTVTIPFTSAANATAAQNALFKISEMVQANFLTQYQYPGSGSVPLPAILGGVVVSGSTPQNVGLLPAGYYSVANNATNGIPTTVTGIGGGSVAVTLPGTTVTGTYNPMTVASGQGGIVFLNVSSNASIFLGGGTNIIAEGYTGAKAVINADVGDTFVGAALGSTTVNAFSGAAVQVSTGGTGTAVINALGDNQIGVIGGGGAPVTVNAARGANLQFIGTANAPAYINLTKGNVTVAANSGALTLTGGFSGNALVFANHGVIGGGTGTNYLITDSLAGATTLFGAGANDTMIGQGAGNTYVANGASDLISDLSGGKGATYISGGGGQSTIMGSLGANSTFNLGAGTVMAYGQHGLSLNQGNVYTDAYNGANKVVIGDFVQGLDAFSLTHSASGASLVSINYYSTTGTSTFGAVGTEAILSDGTKIDFLQFDVTKSAFT